MGWRSGCSKCSAFWRYSASRPGPAPVWGGDERWRARRYRVVGAVGAGYMGIYLCRKTLGVAVRLLQTGFHANKGQIGRIASLSTLAYAAGKLALGPLVDRAGGRAG